MQIKTRAHNLLDDWGHYRELHYSNKTHFANALDIEIEKDTISQLVPQLHEALITGKDLTPVVESLALHLRTYKDRITFELLKNGINPNG